MDEWLRQYEVPPEGQQEVEALDTFLVDTLKRLIREKLPGETAVQIGSKGSTARGTQSLKEIDFDLAVVGIDPERHEEALNAVLTILRDVLVRDVRFRHFALRVFGEVPELIIEPFNRCGEFWLGRLMVNVELVDIAIEPEGSIGLWYTSWIRKKMTQMSPDAARRARASSRLLKDVMKRLHAFKVRTGGLRGIVAELLILQLGGDFTTVMEKLYSYTIVDTGDAEHFEIRPQAVVAEAWLVPNPAPQRAAPHPFHNLLMYLDHVQPGQPLETNGWNWRVLATLAWRVHWMRRRSERLDVGRLVGDVGTLVGSQPPGDTL